jgi:ATP-binding cassette, subfamily B, bacterial PglK
MKQYFHEFLFLVGEDKKKLPFLILFFMVASFLDLAGLGLIGPYVALIINPDALLGVAELRAIFKSMGVPFGQRQLLILLSLALALIFLIKAGAGIFIAYLITTFVEEKQVRLRSSLMQIYQDMPYQEYVNRNSAAYIHAIQNNIGHFTVVLQNILKSVSDGLIGVAIFVMLAWSSGVALSILIFLLGGLVVGYDRIYRGRLGHFGKISHDASISMLQGIHEGIEGLKEIRILGKSQYFNQVVHSSAQKVAKYGVKVRIIATVPRFLLEFTLVAFISLLVMIVVLLEQDIKALVPTLAIFGVAALRVIPMASIFSNTLTSLRSSRFPISTLYADFQGFGTEEKSFLTLSAHLKLNASFRELTIQHVRFCYLNSQLPVLDDVSLIIRNGESIGLIGASGSGKTTLVDVLLGLLEAQEGEVLYNGEPLSETLTEMRSHIAYLPQEIFLIDNTLRHNIALGMNDNEIDDLLLNKVLLQSRLMELVEQLPNGVDTLLGERGVRLSGGQRQRVALARAFYHGRSILVMDEATSALDSEIEKEIVEEIKFLKGEKTVIVIAHRLTTLKHCNRIYRLANGKIVECGSYSQVIEKTVQ